MNVYPASVLAPDASLGSVVLRLADDHLVLGHRLSQWCGHAPMLEEDLSMPNMALDVLGQSLALYEYVVELNAGVTGDSTRVEQSASEPDATAAQLKAASSGRASASARCFDSADALAYLRLEREYVNCLLVEKPDVDFAHAMLKQLYFSAFMLEWWQAQEKLQDKQLAAIAAKAVKEVAYHLRHSGEWVIRLGDGTAESTERMNQALNNLHPYTGELFVADEVHEDCVQRALIPALDQLKSRWEVTIANVLQQAGLKAPEVTFAQTGGRVGHHSEDFGFILAELQYMQRAYPDMQW